MTRDSEHDCADTQSKRTLSRPIATVFTLFRAFIGLNAELFGGLCQKDLIQACLEQLSESSIMIF